ncbi:MAG: 6-phosphogluconolactonase [Litorimonas sp.]
MTLPVRVFPTPDALAPTVAREIAARLRQLVERRREAVFVPSSGRTPEPVYRALRDDHANSLDWNRVHILQMDEYADPDLAEARTFRAFLQRQLLRPLKVGRFTGLRTAGERADAIRVAERIDLVLHGIGCNGHIGFNEPGAPCGDVLDSVMLTPQTMRSNFGNRMEDHPRPIGYTLGLETLRKAGHSVLMATGAHKRAAVGRLLGGATIDLCPAAILRDAPSAEVVLDRAAAGQAYRASAAA